MAKFDTYKEYSKKPTSELYRIKLRLEEFINEYEHVPNTVGFAVDAVWLIRLIIAERIGK